MRHDVCVKLVTGCVVTTRWHWSTLRWHHSPATCWRSTTWHRCMPPALEYWGIVTHQQRFYTASAHVYF